MTYAKVAVKLEFVFLGIGLYLGVLVVIKEIAKKNFWFYLDTLNVKKMIIYIRDELKGK